MPDIFNPFSLFFSVPSHVAGRRLRKPNTVETTHPSLPRIVRAMTVITIAQISGVVLLCTQTWQHPFTNAVWLKHTDANVMRPVREAPQKGWS